MPSIDSQTTRLPWAKRRFFHVSVSGFQLILRSGATAGVNGMPRLTRYPANATATATLPAMTGPAPAMATTSPPAIVPSRIATNVPISTRPLPPTSSSGFRCCGRIAYLTGPNSVECTPISASATISSVRLRCQKPARPITMIAISNSLM